MWRISRWLCFAVGRSGYGIPLRTTTLLHKTGTIYQYTLPRFGGKHPQLEGRLRLAVLLSKKSDLFFAPFFTSDQLVQIAWTHPPNRCPPRSSAFPAPPSVSFRCGGSELGASRWKWGASAKGVMGVEGQLEARVEPAVVSPEVSR